MLKLQQINDASKCDSRSCNNCSMGYNQNPNLSQRESCTQRIATELLSIINAHETHEE